MIVLLGEPRSTQHCYRYACRNGRLMGYMYGDCKTLKEDYQYQALSQWKKKRLEGDIRLEARLFFSQKRTHDIDNYNKLLLDSLSGIVFEDDGQIVELIIKKFHDKERPRIEVDIL